MNFLKDWMSVHTEQALAAPEPLFARHHVYPVCPCLSVCLSVCLLQDHVGCLSVPLRVHSTDCLSRCLPYLHYLFAALVRAELIFKSS